MERRDFLRAAVVGGTALTVGVAWPRLFADAAGGTGPYGALGPADGNGVQLPAGFTYRVVATTGAAVASTGYIWHTDPDGGATFATGDGGWIYVSNSESASGGASMIRFSSTGQVVDADRILSGTSRNCAGGATPWGRWLSCEETATGQVWECDPTGVIPAVAWPAMGAFKHEAAAVDPVRRHIYLTEDELSGALYRFAPTSWPDLSSGTLQVLTDVAGVLGWATVPNPTGVPVATRDQVVGTRRFNGGEGAWFDGGKLYFTTKGDNRVRTYDPVANSLAVIYDASSPAGGVLTGVDNVTVSRSGDVFVAEDGGNMEFVILSPEGDVAPFLRLATSGSEITGPAFDPSGTRLYFSSQRNPGRTYEITGPFRSTSGTTTTSSSTTTTASTTTTTTSSTTTTTQPVVIKLTAKKRTAKRIRYVDLKWSGATAPTVEVRRNGSVLTTTANDGSFTDTIGSGGGTFAYRIAHPGGTPISNEVKVTF